MATLLIVLVLLSNRGQQMSVSENVYVTLKFNFDLEIIFLVDFEL